MMGMGEKTPKTKKDEIKEKFPVWLPSTPRVYEIQFLSHVHISSCPIYFTSHLKYT